jgi:DNA modification methylase
MTDKQAADLRKSIERLNLMSIPVVDADNTIISGHMRLRTMSLLNRGQETIDVRVPNRKLTPDEYLEANLRENKNVGEWDFDLLAAFDESVLTGVGFNAKELKRIFDVQVSDDDFDVAGEAAKIKKAETEPGDVWILGKHRMICGDAAIAETYHRLMQGEQAALVVTDPPYNVNYAGKGKKTSRGMENDNLEEQAFRELLRRAFLQMHAWSGPNAPLYSCYASRTHREFEDALNDAGWQVRNQIIWVKAVASMGWGDYRWKHEPILYCKKDQGTAPFYGDHKEYTEWKEYTTDDELLVRVKKLIEIDEKGGSTVWRISRDKHYEHPTQKPVQLFETAITNSSLKGEPVLDPFCGSGTIFVAAELTGRAARGIEIDPIFCDVIVKRWENLTGEKACKFNVAERATA